MREKSNQHHTPTAPLASTDLEFGVLRKKGTGTHHTEMQNEKVPKKSAKVPWYRKCQFCGLFVPTVQVKTSDEKPAKTPEKKAVESAPHKTETRSSGMSGEKYRNQRKSTENTSSRHTSHHAHNSSSDAQQSSTPSYLKEIALPLSKKGCAPIDLELADSYRKPVDRSSRSKRASVESKKQSKRKSSPRTQPYSTPKTLDSSPDFCKEAFESPLQVCDLSAKTVQLHENTRNTRSVVGSVVECPPSPAIESFRRESRHMLSRTRPLSSISDTASSTNYEWSPSFDKDSFRESSHLTSVYVPVGASRPNKTSRPTSRVPPERSDPAPIMGSEVNQGTNSNQFPTDLQPPMIVPKLSSKRAPSMISSERSRASTTTSRSHGRNSLSADIKRSKPAVPAVPDGAPKMHRYHRSVDASLSRLTSPSYTTAHSTLMGYETTHIGAAFPLYLPNSLPEPSLSSADLIDSPWGRTFGSPSSGSRRSSLLFLERHSERMSETASTDMHTILSKNRISVGPDKDARPRSKKHRHSAKHKKRHSASKSRDGGKLNKPLPEPPTELPLEPSNSSDEATPKISSSQDFNTPPNLASAPVATPPDEIIPTTVSPFSDDGVIGNMEGRAFQAVYAYTPQLTDELQLVPGDIVKVYQVFDDGWCFGQREDLRAHGLGQGICPRVCLTPLS